MRKEYAGLEHYGLENDMVTYERHLYIPNNNSLKLIVTTQYHNAKGVGHFARDEGLKLIKCDYYWPNMEHWIRNYVQTCDACRRNKTIQHKKYDKLIPLPIPY